MTATTKIEGEKKEKTTESEVEKELNERMEERCRLINSGRSLETARHPNKHHELKVTGNGSISGKPFVARILDSRPKMRVVLWQLY